MLPIFVCHVSLGASSTRVGRIGFHRSSNTSGVLSDISEPPRRDCSQSIFWYCRLITMFGLTWETYRPNSWTSSSPPIWSEWLWVMTKFLISEISKPLSCMVCGHFEPQSIRIWSSPLMTSRLFWWRFLANAEPVPTKYADSSPLLVSAIDSVGWETMKDLFSFFKAVRFCDDPDSVISWWLCVFVKDSAD